VAWAESSHEQFGEDGYPLYGPSDGFGVMQLDTIPDFKKREEHFWDWRANARKGGEYLDQLYRKDATNYLKHWHGRDEKNPDKPSWGWNPADAATDAAVAERIWDEAFSRYHRGPLHSPDGNGGKKSCQLNSTFRKDKGDENKNGIFDGYEYQEWVRGHIAKRPWETGAKRVVVECNPDDPGD